MSHMLQYAIVGDTIVYHTEAMTDEQLRERVGPRPIERYNRCPACEEWTLEGGKLRKESKCPAVRDAIKGGATVINSGAWDGRVVRAGRVTVILPGG